jgi:hypothetical protein
MFDYKLQWFSHISKVINKADRALSGIKLISKFFNKQEQLQLLTSNFFSILYYISEEWLLGTLKRSIKQQLLSASTKTIHYSDIRVSYLILHKVTKRATPQMYGKYKLALSTEWCWPSGLNLQHIVLDRSRYMDTKVRGLNPGATL